MLTISYNPRLLDVDSLSEGEIELLEIIYRKGDMIDHINDVVEGILSQLSGQNVSFIEYNYGYKSFKFTVNRIEDGFLMGQGKDRTHLHIKSRNIYHPAILSYLKCL